MNILVFGITALLVVWQALEAALLLTRAEKAGLGHLFAAVSAFVAGMVTSATLLAILGLYSLARSCLLVLLALVAVKLVLRWKKGIPLFSLRTFAVVKPSLRRPAPATLVAVLVLLAAGSLYALFPTNYLFGGRDYGLYEINAVHVSNTGGYQYESDEFYAERYEDVKDFVKLAYPALYNARQQGITDDVGKLDPQFLPMPSAGMALLYDCLGFTGLLRFNAILAVLCLFTVFLLARYLFDDRAAVLATLFLAVCPAQLWGARIAGSELLAQWLFLLAAYCMAIGWQNKRQAWMVLAGALLGIGCFNRIDNYILLVGLYGVACYSLLWRQDRAPGLLKGAGVATALAGVSVWYGFSFHHDYYTGHWRMNSLRLLLIGCVAALLLTGLLAALRKPLAKLSLKNPVALAGTKAGTWTLCGVCVLLFLYAYFLRPLLGVRDANTLVEYSWYISALAVPLAIVGMYRLLRDRRGLQAAEPALFFVLCGLANVVMYTWRPSVTPDHFWASRRWVPVNNPFLLVLAAAGVVFLWRAARAFGGKRLLALGARAVSVGCAVVVAGYMLWQCRLFIVTPMLAGINGQYAALAEHLPDGGLVITGNANIASVLKYVYNKPVYLWNSTAEEIERADANGDTVLSYTPLRLAAVEEYLEKYGELYVIGTPGLFWQMGAIEQVYDSVLAANYPEESVGSYPAALERWEMDVAVYRLTPSAEAKHYDFLRGQALGNASTRNADWSISLSRQETVFYGPYTSLYAGSYRLEIDLEGDDSFEALLKIQLEAGTYVVTEERFESPGTYVVEFSFDENKDGLEFALENEGYSTITCTRLELFELEE